MKKRLLPLLACLMIGIVILVNLNQANTISKATNLEEVVTIEGKVTNEEDAKEVLTLLENNLEAINQKDMSTYLNTLITSAQAETKKEIEPIFKNFDLENTLLSFKVVKQNDQQIIVKTKQKTVNHNNHDYRNHIASANHTFIKQDGQWKVKESIMTNTKFIQ